MSESDQPKAKKQIPPAGTPVDQRLYNELAHKLLRVETEHRQLADDYADIQRRHIDLHKKHDALIDRHRAAGPL